MTDNNEKLKKWFKGEIAIAFAVGSLVVGAINYFSSPVNSLNVQMAVVQNQIAELKANDLVHIELEQTDLTQQQTDEVGQINDLDNKVTEILTILKQPVN